MLLQELITKQSQVIPVDSNCTNHLYVRYQMGSKNSTSSFKGFTNTGSYIDISGFDIAGGGSLGIDNYGQMYAL